MVQGKIGQVSEARKTRQEASQIAKNLADGRSKVYALRDVAYAQAEGEDRSTALETLRQAEQAATAIQDINEQSNALQNLVFAHTSFKDYQGALRTTASMKEFEIVALEWIAQSLPKESGHVGREVLKQVFQKVQSTSVSTADKPNALLEIAAAYARLGDLKTALEVADSLGNWKGHALERMAIAQAKAGEFEGAFRTVTAIDQENPAPAAALSRANVLQAIALAQEKAGDRAAARATFQKLRQIADKLPPRRAGGRGSGVTSTTMLWEGIVVAQVHLGDIESALQTASALPSPYDKAKALLEIGRAQVEAGKLADARETLFRGACAVEDSQLGTEAGGPAGRSGPSEHMKSATLRLIAQQQAKAGDIKQALRTVKALPANRHVRDVALFRIVRAQAQAGDVKGGLETLSQIQDDEGKAIVLEDLVQAQVQAGDERGALALAARQASPLLKAHALLAIASSKIKQKATKE